MSVPEPKVAHHYGRGIRSCPIFPELRPILDEAFEIFGEKSEFVVALPSSRAASNGERRWFIPLFCSKELRDHNTI